MRNILAAPRGAAARGLAALLLVGAMTIGTACGSGEQSYGGQSYGGQSRGAGYGGQTSGTGYGGQARSGRYGYEAPTRQQHGGEHGGGVATGDTQHGAQFARWVLDQDPRRQYITDAVVRDDRHLGVKVQPNITRGDLHQLLESLAIGMSREFPGREIEVTAFYQSGDKLAEAYLDPRSRQVQVEMAS